jgi:hypothetical protein
MEINRFGTNMRVNEANQMVVYSTKTNLHEDKYCDVGNN